MADNELPAWPASLYPHIYGWVRCSCGVYRPPAGFCANPDCEARRFLLDTMLSIAAKMPPPSNLFAMNDIQLFEEVVRCTDALLDELKVQPDDD